MWTFELPSITLRRRQPVDWGKDGRSLDGMAAVSPHGLLVGWLAGQDNEDPSGCSIVTDMEGHWRDLPVTAPERPKNVAMSNDWIALPVNELRGAHAASRQWRVIHLLDTVNRAVRMRIALDGAGPAGVRIQGDRLVVFDGSGRVMAISLSSGAVLREHRLT
jgi:hypothetical protein